MMMISLYNRVISTYPNTQTRRFASLFSYNVRRRCPSTALTDNWWHSIVCCVQAASRRRALTMKHDVSQPVSVSSRYGDTRAANRILVNCIKTPLVAILSPMTTLHFLYDVAYILLTVFDIILTPVFCRRLLSIHTLSVFEYRRPI